MEERLPRQQPARMTLRPTSLRAQLAFGSAIVAVLAVALVALWSYVVVGLNTHNLRQAQLATETTRMATLLGQRRSALDGPDTSPVLAGGPPPRGETQTPFLSPYIVWGMDLSGRLRPLNPIKARGQASDQDVVALEPLLQQALHGQISSGSLQAPAFGLPPFVNAQQERLYAVTPVYSGGDSSQPVIGGIALLTPPDTSAQAGVFSSVDGTIIFATIAVALLAAGAAVLFSRRLTQPLQRLTLATSQVAAGDLSARVNLAAPDEMRVLGQTFNQMTATLQQNRVEIERQERLRRDLIANVSHDLATPLTTLQGFTEALADGVVEEGARREKTFAVMNREVARLRRLVDQLREVALIESGTLQMGRQPVALVDVINDTLAALGPAIDQADIHLRWQASRAFPPVYANPDRVVEILVNLLDNAIRYTPTGGAISITCAQSGEFARIDIEDTGPGVAPETQANLFERFYRADTSRNSTTGGSGLGLAIVKALIEAHGGAIWLESGAEGGARFSFTLPLVLAAAPSTTDDTPPPTASRQA